MYFVLLLTTFSFVAIIRTVPTAVAARVVHLVARLPRPVGILLLLVAALCLLALLAIRLARFLDILRFVPALIRLVARLATLVAYHLVLDVISLASLLVTPSRI